MLLTPGFVAERIFSLISRGKSKGSVIANAIVFNLIIFTINTVGLFYLYGLQLYSTLQENFNYLSFVWKYSLLSIAVGIILAIISGILARFVFSRNTNTIEKGN
jgi:hypothetical protein